jgi:hypothetical protein
MTENTTSLSQDLQALEQHLAAYGPDLARWPVHSQQQFAVLLASDSTAQRMLSEAKALESVVAQGLLGAGPERESSTHPTQKSRGIRDSVLQAAAREGAPGMPLLETPEFAATRFDPATIRSLNSKRTVGGDRGHDRRSPSLFGWPAGAMLAASLVLGILIGARGMTDRGFASGGVSGLDQTAADDNLDAADELAFDVGIGDVDEEDTL